MSGLASFIAALMVYAETVQPARIFVGIQHGATDGTEYAWTKCVPESGVFVVQVAERIEKVSREAVIFAAAHEVCHIRLHGEAMCAGAVASATLARRREMESEADRCATMLVTQ